MSNEVRGQKGGESEAAVLHDTVQRAMVTFSLSDT